MLSDQWHSSPPSPDPSQPHPQGPAPGSPASFPPAGPASGAFPHDAGPPPPGHQPPPVGYPPAPPPAGYPPAPPPGFGPPAVPPSGQFGPSVPGSPPAQRGVNAKVLIGVVAAVVVLVGVSFGIWGITQAGGDAKTPAGATAAFNHIIDLARKGDYGGMYDRLDRQTRAAMPKDTFTLAAKCINLAGAVNKADPYVVSARVEGDSAYLEIGTSGDPSSDDSSVDDSMFDDGGPTVMVYEDRHWRLSSEGDESFSPEDLLFLHALCG